MLVTNKITINTCAVRPGRWKDVRKIDADFLVDDSPQHREAARAFGLESAYIVVPQYGSPTDAADPLGWVQMVEAVVKADQN